jgi:L-aminopeptidase/D-esterase-like protein
VTITDVPGVRVGHWSDAEARTGCTVVLLPPEGAVAGVDVRGPAPGTRETDLLRPGMLVERAHAICLCGGSAFGLAAADGVMRYLRERGVGVRAGPARVPIVPAAVVFDLASGASDRYPGAEEGYAACLRAESRAAEEPLEGGVGAGTGATLGKLRGLERSSPGGVGSAAIRLPGGALVGALAVVNAVGDVVDEEGRLVAGVEGRRLLLEEGVIEQPLFGANTTLGVVATDATLDKVRCAKLAELGHDALALAVRPRTMFDGDTVFAVSTCRAPAADMTSLGAAAVEALRRAIVRAVRRD